MLGLVITLKNYICFFSNLDYSKINLLFHVIRTVLEFIIQRKKLLEFKMKILLIFVIK